MNLKKQNGTYVCYYKDLAGKTRQINTRQTNLKDAKDVVAAAGIAKLEKAAVANALTEQVVNTLLQRPGVPCKDLVNQWLASLDNRARSPKTLHTYAATVRAWLKDRGLSGKPPAKIREEDVDAYVNPEGTLSLSARKSRLSVISGFCDWCARNRHMSADPALPVDVKLRGLSHRQKEGGKRLPFTENEYNRFMAYLDMFMADPDPRRSVENAQFWQSAIPLSYWTGLRLSDICLLEWDSISAHEIIVWTQKRQTRVALPLDDELIGSGELMDVLQDLPHTHDRFVFPRHRAIYEDVTARSFFSKDFPRWRDSAGLAHTGKTFHCLRHSFATRLKRAGKTIEEIGRFVGHRDERVTQGYTHL